MAGVGPEVDEVLVVEDDESAAYVVEQMLKELGFFRIVCVTTVEEALKHLALARPKVVILDASLRGKSSHLVAAQLNEDQVPFIVATGYDPLRLPDAFNAGKPLRKPYDLAAFAAALKALPKK